MIKISSNTLILNELKHIDGLIKNLLDAKVDEMIFLDGGSTDGTYEKLKEYEEKYEFIRAIRWKQPKNSEYRKGFREKDRRNLMMDVSTSDYILYIDADERINLDFKNKITSTFYQSIVTTRYHFWGDKLRINVKKDKVWTPEYQFRIVKNNNKIRFKSSDVNGLHNYLSYKGFKVLGGFNGNKVKRVISKLNNSFMGFTNKIEKDIKIYHLHYLSLENAMKKNDLRGPELSKKIFLVNKIEDGMNYMYPDICCTKGKNELKKIKNYI